MERVPLPYRLESIEISNLFDISAANLTNLPGDASWVFLTGQEGMTQFLQGIVLAYYNHQLAGLSPEILPLDATVKLGLIRDDVALPRLDYTFRGEDIRRGAFHPRRERVPYLLAYGNSRQRFLPEHPSYGQQTPFSAVASLFSNEARLRDVLTELYVSSLEDAQRFVRLRDLLIRAWPTLQNIQVINRELVFYTTGGTTLQWQQLPNGARCLLMMVGDIYLRLSESQGPDVRPQELSGIVLIDEPELHMHPTYRRMLPRTLSGLFPRIQFMAATYSPVLLTGAPSNSIFLKLDRVPEGRLEVERLDLTLKGMLPSQILATPLFDLQEMQGEPIGRAPLDYDLDQVLEEELDRLAPPNESNPGRLYGGH